MKQFNLISLGNLYIIDRRKNSVNTTLFNRRKEDFSKPIRSHIYPLIIQNHIGAKLDILV